MKVNCQLELQLIEKHKNR